MASAMRAARAQLETATQNLANAGTDGFRTLVGRVSLGDAGLSVSVSRGAEQGAVRETGRPFDLALLGPGAFQVDGGSTRAGSFTRDRDGYLRDDGGRRLHGAHGALRVSADATIDGDGTVRDRGHVVDRLPLATGTRVRSGALETSGVNPIGETLAILTAQRAFETAQKTLSAIDAAREHAANDVVRLK